MTRPLIIHQFPCLMDNYGYLLHSPDTLETAAIDTPDADAIRQNCQDKGWSLTHIWNTHHHFDHTGGNMDLKAVEEVKIIGSEDDRKRIAGLDIGVRGGDSFEFGGHTVTVIDTPGHTIGHICYYIESMGAAFVGDTIFALGCGRLFEGSPAQMFDSLAKVTALPDDTLLYCAHEYTVSNGRFALHIDPENSHLTAFMHKAQQLRDSGKPTVPTTVKLEKAANPFVRAKTAEELGRIRALKDNFRG